jgi:hypothetical protein
MCIPLGNCYFDYDEIDNSLPAHSYIPWHWTDTSYYRPIGDQGKVTRKCHEGWTVSVNSCEYVCEDWYYCSSSDWICTKWPFKCFNWHLNKDSAYMYENPTATSDRRSTNSLYVYETHVEWDFESDEDLKKYAIRKYGEEWCYFSCKSWYVFQDSVSPLALWCYSPAELNAYECSNNYPNVAWFLERVMNPQVKDQARKWTEDYNEYLEIKSKWCAATCQPWSRIVSKNGKKICLKDCPPWKYFMDGGIILVWWCYNCDEWFIPDTKNDLLDWVPTKCVGACVSYWNWFVYNPKTKSCVWPSSASGCEEQWWYWWMVDGEMKCIIWVPEE